MEMEEEEEEQVATKPPKIHRLDESVVNRIAAGESNAPSLPSRSSSRTASTPTPPPLTSSSRTAASSSSKSPTTATEFYLL
ncbi:hypothetical protein RchiOBHm_Chr7g0226941 [Rosa chinensis]|uniref:Uncharacterized protein n=1 Tax=Rosa chinensis TaxID=74649 RepID=A0A2P6PEJ0_ROSCH|nr:hypothetical protein RchiOBHm_Chr7g0226941 [Rosa chinensis]